MDEVTVVGGDVVMIDGAPYLVVKAEVNGDSGYTVLASLIDGNFWSSPIQVNYRSPMPLSLFESAVDRGAEKIGKISSFNGRSAFRN